MGTDSLTLDNSRLEIHPPVKFFLHIVDPVLVIILAEKNEHDLLLL